MNPSPKRASRPRVNPRSVQVGWGSPMKAQLLEDAANQIQLSRILNPAVGFPHPTCLWRNSPSMSVVFGLDDPHATPEPVVVGGREVACRDLNQQSFLRSDALSYGDDWSPSPFVVLAVVNGEHELLTPDLFCITYTGSWLAVDIVDDDADPDCAAVKQEVMYLVGCRLGFMYMTVNANDIGAA